ncbi:MAG: glycogen synthase GlgA [Clostridiales bacterium]|nr:glycogen synthase GlgA [Clostridiales bacterium]
MRVTKKKLLFVASEAAPFIATGGLAEVVGSLSKALAKTKRYDVRVILPLYEDIRQDYRAKFEYLGNFNVNLSWRKVYCGVFRYVLDGVTYYFVDNEHYFKRHGLYGHFDDGERFAFFGKAVLDTMGFVDFYPDIMHCHDWQAAPALLYLKTEYCHYVNYRLIRALFTIHNIEYQGKYDLGLLENLFGISRDYINYLEYGGAINLMKGAIELSDSFSTVSPSYAQEIKYEYYAHGLHPIIRRNGHKLCGILNGIDIDYYNPATDKALFANYSAEDLANKAICKQELQKMLNLPVNAHTPILAMITRLVAHKGLDLVKAVMEEALQDDVQLVVLGTGEWEYEQYFKYLAGKYPDKVAAKIEFNSDLSRKIYSGADLFLMPSKSEPCGLSQMIASRYGTVAIVRETGGLKDSITPYGVGGNGFTFANYNAHDMLYVLREALKVYRKGEEWSKLAFKAATTDFSWSKSANEYETLYNSILK